MSPACSTAGRRAAERGDERSARPPDHGRVRAQGRFLAARLLRRGRRSEIFRFLVRLPKLTDGTDRSTFIDALASEKRGAGLYRAQGEREGRSIDIDQLLLFTIRDGLVTEVLALPSDPVAFDDFWQQ